MPKSSALLVTSIKVALLKIAVSTGILAISTTEVLANNDPLNVSALTGDYVPGNPGLEIVIPSLKKVDNKSLNFHFDVFKLGTKIKLFSTAPRVFSTCGFSKPDYSYTPIGNNIVTTINGYCPGSGLYSSHVYGVDVSAAKTPWTKSFSGQLIGTGIVGDKNKNGVDEVSVIVGTEVGGGGSDYSVYVYDAKTGAAVATTQKYAVER
jgi:hypothetical protein